MEISLIVEFIKKIPCIINIIDKVQLFLMNGLSVRHDRTNVLTDSLLRSEWFEAKNS